MLCSMLCFLRTAAPGAPFFVCYYYEYISIYIYICVFVGGGGGLVLGPGPGPSRILANAFSKNKVLDGRTH